MMTFLYTRMMMSPCSLLKLFGGQMNITMKSSTFQGNFSGCSGVQSRDPLLEKCQTTTLRTCSSTLQEGLKLFWRQSVFRVLVRSLISILCTVISVQSLRNLWGMKYRAVSSIAMWWKEPEDSFFDSKTHTVHDFSPIMPSGLCWFPSQNTNPTKEVVSVPQHSQHLLIRALNPTAWIEA